MPGAESQELKAKFYRYNWLTQHFLFKSLKKAREYVRGELLDVGCGSKPYEEFFSGSVSRYVGVDLQPERSANKLPKKADLFCDISRGLPFEPENFDTVLCTEVLEHVSEPDRLIKEIARVLRPGGHLILTAPQCWGLHEEPHDYYRFTKYGLKYLVEKNGLQVVEIINRGGFWAMLGQRLSGLIHYNYVEKKNILMKIIFKPLYIVLSRICFMLDILSKQKGDTLGNTLVARKKEKKPN